MARPDASTAGRATAPGAAGLLDELGERLLAHPRRQLVFYGGDRRLAHKTFAEIHRDVEELAAELAAAGLRARSVVGLAGPNSYAWILADLALLRLGCVSIAFPEAMVSGDLEELGKKYGLDCLLITGQPAAAHRAHRWIGSLDDRPLRLELRRPGAPGDRWPADVFSLSFSSGTTGDSKCLLMSKQGIENTVRISCRAWAVGPTDNIFITMPFSSVQQRTMVYMAIWQGFDISMAPPERMRKALKEMSPTIFIGAPSFFEFVENEYFSLPARRRAIPALLARLTEAVLPRGAARRLKRLLFRQFHRAFGKRMRLLIVGSAPSKRSMLEIYDRLGLPLYEVYGANEFGWIALNLPGANRIGTVGKPAEGVKIEIAPDGEVIVSGPHRQTLGYAFGGESQQRAVYLPDGRIATGDTGRFDDDGFLRLVGRKKNVIITKGGHKINPESIEAAIEKIAGVDRAVVFGGDPLPSLVCVIWPGAEAGEAAQAEIRAAIDLMNQAAQAPERIDRIIFRTAGELTVDSNLLTRNFKVNRTAIFEKYKDLITGGAAESQP